ncbi:hypothetical protein SISNIDRAFT_253078 [Sistotremastrum niveocremeum HHB9708]|uniref:Uncharacterized protein n=2 Tax=Sistotremastraceae TaxID=3402574 RepID=A0A164Z2W1_9AGAM|nr:hypothetical protein SISNIDRAFT_253078 [Sistotremastrum niveocremeum HHB9708]KZT34066.1 hypothetical protein SISSUDRAFT_318802 [Sistotremastrum suecicum HHB10207 ss-3]
MTRDQESSYDLSYIVMRMIALDVDRKEISLITALSEPAIRDIESRFKGTRLLNVPEVPLRDPFLFTCRDDLSKSDASFIDEVVRRRPHIFIPELLEELLEEHCIKSTADNVLIELRKRGLRRQQVYKFAKGRLEELRDQYDDIISSYTYDKLVFVGESQVETKNAFSPTVSSPQKPRQTRSTSRRSEPRPARSNAVSALGHEGVIHSEVFDHELRVAESTKFFKELVRRMSKSRRSVIALDPSFTRRDAKISDICNKA